MDSQSYILNRGKIFLKVEDILFIYQDKYSSKSLGLGRLCRFNELQEENKFLTSSKTDSTIIIDNELFRYIKESKPNTTLEKFILGLFQIYLGEPQGKESESKVNDVNKIEESNNLFPYCEDLTESAKKNNLDPVIGRNHEINRIVSVILRKKKNNVLLLGEAGVGKTAIVEKLAYLISKEKVPKKMKDMKILQLDISQMLAGSSNRGEFEGRVTELISSISDKNILLFIDEIHTIVGAGSDGNLDFSNIIKPALARGEIKCIGATTTSEYKLYLQNDRALSRRFDNIIVLEPTEKETEALLVKIKKYFEDYHKVYYSNEVVHEIVKMANKVFPNRKFPDKAIDLMDELGVNSNMNNETDVSLKDIEVIGLNKENIIDNGKNIYSRLTDIRHTLNEAMKSQEDVVSKLMNILEPAFFLDVNNSTKCNICFLGKEKYWKKLTLSALSQKLSYNNVINIFLAEYQEKHSLSKILGPPPGYSGSENGGILLDKIKNNSRTILVFHDIIFAHDDIKRFILQILEYGYAIDASGELVSFKDVIIIFDDNNIKDELTSELYLFMDDVIEFREASMNEIQEVILNFIRDACSTMMKKRNMDIELDKSVYVYLQKISSEYSEYSVNFYLKNCRKYILPKIVRKVFFENSKLEKIKVFYLNGEITVYGKEDN